MNELDAIERAGAGAATVHLQKAAELHRDACHQLHLAETASNLAELTPRMCQYATGMQLMIDEMHRTITFALAQASSPYRIRECGNVVFLERDAG